MGSAAQSRHSTKNEPAYENFHLFVGGGQAGPLLKSPKGESSLTDVLLQRNLSQSVEYGLLLVNMINRIIGSPDFHVLSLLCMRKRIFLSVQSTIGMMRAD